jgi:hypothetical protein
MFAGRQQILGASWTAPAERCGDGAFARTITSRNHQGCGPLESGVALRLPPQSMTLSDLPRGPDIAERPDGGAFIAAVPSHDLTI